ncbi:MAG: hypothetical protein K2L42_05610 [Clostridia bacterium]|nr:hypothetical protein [Clostridia bacterium]
MVQILVWKNMNQDEQALAQFVQGVLNRKGYKIFIDIDNYKQFLKEEAKEVDLWELIKNTSSEFSGAVCYDLNCNDVGINMAAIISAATDLLGVPRTIIKKINALGIKTVRDLAEIKGSRAERQRVIFNEYKDKLNKTALVHQVVKQGNFHLVLRDFSIANRWVCVYTSESEEDRALRYEILKWLDTNVPVYGWNDDEIAFIKDISTFGDYAVPTDWSSNHSYFGQNIHTVKQNTPRTPIAENKHYVAIVVSDGDNVQWLEREFFTTSTFGQRQKSAADYKINWTFSPSLAELCPDAAEKIYSFGKKDYFISGVSGVGYANCLSYPREHLDEFTKRTAVTMKDSDLQVVCLLDNISLTENADFVEDRLSSYAKYDNIEGGIWELDPDRYGSGKGKIFWACGKPFVSVRFTMWHPSGKSECVTKEWLDGVAKCVNEMPVSPYSEEGYTVLNVHPWTMSMESLDYVVSQFGEHVELVYADELIRMIKKNLGKK